MAYFTLYTGKDGQYYFNLKAGNHETLVKSEGYKAKASALNGIESVRKNSPEEGRYEAKTTSNDKYYFNLKATNGQVIATSGMYSTEDGRDNGIKVVMRDAADAELKEEE